MMKKENDSLEAFFRNGLKDAELPLREDFWDKLNEKVTLVSHHRRRIVFYRTVAAASVLLILGVASAAFWLFSPKQELKQALDQVALIPQSGSVMEGGGGLPVGVAGQCRNGNSLPVRSTGDAGEADDSVQVRFSMSVSFSSSMSRTGADSYPSSRQETVAMRQTSDSDLSHYDTEDHVYYPDRNRNKKLWAVKPQVGTGLPAAGGKYKMPVTVGVTVERELNKWISLETGLQYTALLSDESNLHHIGVPVKINLNLLKRPKAEFYASVGGLVEKCVAGAMDNSFKAEPIQLAATAGVGVRYKLNDRLTFFAEPGISYHFKRNSGQASLHTERPANLNLLCGLRLSY